MKLPNKLFDYKESVFHDCVILMKEIKDEMTILELYKVCRKKCNSTQSFFDALDVLYAVKKIDYDFEGRRIVCVK